MQFSPTFMKTSGPLTLAFALAFAAAIPVMGADKPKPAAAAPAAPSKAAAIPDPVAVVEGHEIKKAELDSVLENVLKAQGIPASQLPEDQRLQVYHMLLDDMIAERLIANRAVTEKVSDEEVTAQYDKLKAKFGSEEELKSQLEKAGETETKVKTGIRERLQQQRWMDAQVKGKADVTDADAEDFYKKNPDKFKSPEQVRASHILIAVPQDAKPEVVAEKQKAAQAIADRVKKGEAFGKLAKELSEDPSAKQNSGDLDFFTKEQMVPEFSNAAFAMKKDEISDPVRSSFGFHIIKVTDRKEAETVTLEKVKPELMDYLKKQKRTAELEKIVLAIKEKADIKVNLPDAPKASAQ